MGEEFLFSMGKGSTLSRASTRPISCCTTALKAAGAPSPGLPALRAGARDQGSQHPQKNLRPERVCVGLSDMNAPCWYLPQAGLSLVTEDDGFAAEV